MSTYLLTGAAGFIGSHLARVLLERGDAVVGLDEFNDFYDPRWKRMNAAPLEKSGNFTLVQGDIRDEALLEKLFDENKFDAIIHLAARAGVRPSLEQPLLYEDVNVRGTLLLLEACRKQGLKKFLFASSSSVYGNCDTVPFREDMDINYPISPYAATKKATELHGYTYHHLYGMDITGLRYFTVYGPAQRPDMAIRKFTGMMLRGETIPMFGDGSTERDYTFIDDIVDGTVRALDRLGGYHIYNLGESQTISLKDLIALMEKKLGVTAKIKELPMQPGDVVRTFADISRARKELDYLPCVGIEEGMERFIEWYNKIPPLETKES